MVAGAENPLDDQTEAHGIGEAVMRRNASLLLLLLLLLPNQKAAVCHPGTTQKHTTFIIRHGGRNIRLGRSKNKKERK